MSDTIYNAILVEVEKGTFTPDALKRMQDALDKVKNLEARLATAEAFNDSLRKEIADWKAQEREMESERGQLDEWAKALTAREKAIGDAEKRVAVAEAKEYVRKEVFDTIFRNVTVRRSVQSNVPVAQGNGLYPATCTSTETETTDHE